MSLKYQYYVVYTHSSGAGVGAMSIYSDVAISTDEHVHGMCDAIRERNPDVGHVTITNWILLSGPECACACHS